MKDIYQSKRGFFKNWIADTNLKPYFFIIGTMVIAVIAILIFSSQMNVPHGEETQQTEEYTSINTISNEEASTETQTEPLLVSGYSIVVNKADNQVLIWNTINGEKTTQNRVFLASVNTGINIGEYEISEKNIWRNLYENGFVQYSAKSADQLFFHSATYEYQDKGYMRVEEYNNIGSGNSNVPGVILSVRDAKWIYENCQEGTVIEVCEDADMTYEVKAEDFITGVDEIYWDPTDPDRENLWVQTEINYLYGVTDKVINVGDYFDPWKGLIARDTDDNNITSRVVVDGRVDTNTPGVYTLTYVLADIHGNISRQYSTVTVIQKDEVGIDAAEGLMNNDNAEHQN